MRPSIEPGQQVEIFEGAPGRIGDVVLFATADGQDLVLHRVIAAAPGIPWFFHAGDAPDARRPRLSLCSRIVGRADIPRRAPGLDQIAGLGGWVARRVRREIRERLGRG